MGGQQVLMEGQEIVGAPYELAGQVTYASPEGMDGQFVYGAPMVAAAPARINVSPEIFAKLAAGGSLTPDEMAQLSGQPAPAPVMPGSPQRPGSAKASGKKDKKEKKSEKSGSKKALKASKKKKEKGCC